MSSIVLGEVAAVLASVCFSIAPTLNTLAGQRVGIGTVNVTRLLVTVLLLVVSHWLILGEPLPLHAGLDRWVWMGLSGLLTLVLGDTILFLAFSLVGTRLTMQITSLSPVWSVLLAWFMLDERLDWMQIIGILITIGGVAWVISERRNGAQNSTDRQARLKGYALAGAASLLYALGGIAAKKGLAGDFPALSGHLIRTFVSGVVFLIAMLFSGRMNTALGELHRQPISLRLILIGAVIGPFVGMWLAMLSIQKIDVGISASLTSLSPILLLPIGYYHFKEHIGLRAIFGTLLTIVGVAIIFIY